MCGCKSTHTSSFSSTSSAGMQLVENITAEERLFTADQSVNRHVVVVAVRLHLF